MTVDIEETLKKLLKWEEMGLVERVGPNKNDPRKCKWQTTKEGYKYIEAEDNGGDL